MHTVRRYSDFQECCVPSSGELRWWNQRRQACNVRACLCRSFEHRGVCERWRTRAFRPDLSFPGQRGHRALCEGGLGSYPENKRVNRLFSVTTDSVRVSSARKAHDPTRVVAGCAGRIGQYTNPMPNILSLSRARHQRVEPANNLLGLLAKDDVFTGRACL